MPSPRATGHPTQVLFVLLLADVSFALSQTLVVPALPQISREFSTGASSASWVLTGFLLSASVATPIVGKLGDLYGNGRVLTVVLVMFSLGGVVCALASSIGERKRPDPLIDLGILSERAVAATNLTGFMIGFAMFSSFLLIPQSSRRRRSPPATASARR